MLTLEKLLLELSLGDLDLNSLVDLLLVSALVVGIVLDGGGEEGVDKGRLSKAGLASDLCFQSAIFQAQLPPDTMAQGRGAVP